MPIKFDTEEKRSLILMMNNEILIGEKVNTIGNAIKIYCKSVLEALNCNDISLIVYPNILDL